MGTYDLYALGESAGTWDVPAAGAARFTWEYDGGRDRLLGLYQRGKDRQWDAATRIAWDLELDPDDPFGLPEQANPLYGTPLWDALPPARRTEVSRHLGAWQFSQFLHGEQGALLCSARIVESVPDLDAKYYAATQVMDEARHVEAYARLLQEKVHLAYPASPHLRALLDDTLTDSRWDMPYLGMQVLVEGLALAAFGVIRDMTTAPLVRQILAYVMADEARHVAFGRLALKDYYAQLTDAERRDREDFVVEGSHLMHDRFRGDEVWQALEMDSAQCLEAVESSAYLQAFRTLLFSRIVPCVRDIGLFGPRLRRAWADMGVLQLADVDLDALMAADEDRAAAEDRAMSAARERADAADMARRAEQVAATVEAGRG